MPRQPVQPSGLLSLAALLCTAAFASDEPAMTKSTSITRTGMPPVVDGVLDDAAWAQAVVVSDLHQVTPLEYAEPGERTEFLLLYDDDAIYVGLRAYDSAPDEIVAKVLRQGEGLRGEDRIRLILGPFNDKRSGYNFMLNANSVRLEGIFKDGEFDREWTGIWQGQAAIVDDGWVAEIRIPFKTLTFGSESGWAINFSREIARTQEEVAWVSRNNTVNPATSGTLDGMSGLSQGAGLDIVPAVSLTGTRLHDEGAEDSAFEPSLDVFYKLTQGINASLTINTDFSATEVDNRQVNLTRFGLFFPEKRAFFLRESDIFEFGGIGGDDDNTVIPRADQENGRPYFSRRIGLSSTGQPVDLDVGGKLSGRAGEWNIGVQAIRQAEYDDIDATDIFVARVSRNIFEESSVGIILTDGDPRSNLDNSLAGVDFLYRNTRLPGGKEFDASVWYQQSNTEGTDGDDAAWGLTLRAPNNTGWRGGIGLRQIEENFLPALGFVARTGIRQQQADVGYTYRHNGATVRTVAAGIDAMQINFIDGGLQSRRVNVKPLDIENNSGDKAALSWREDKERLIAPFEISDGIVIPEGTYSFGTPELKVETGDQRPLVFEFSYADGEFFDGTIRSIGSEIEWTPSRHFSTQLSYRVDDIDLPAGSFTAKLVSTRLDFIFSNTLSWVNLVQYDNVSETVGVNSRLHWVPEAGRNVYLVLNHNLAERTTDESFHSTTTDLTVKADYTFRF